MKLDYAKKLDDILTGFSGFNVHRKWDFVKERLTGLFNDDIELRDLLQHLEDDKYIESIMGIGYNITPKGKLFLTDGAYSKQVTDKIEAENKKVEDRNLRLEELDTAKLNSERTHKNNILRRIGVILLVISIIVGIIKILQSL